MYQCPAVSYCYIQRLHRNIITCCRETYSLFQQPMRCFVYKTTYDWVRLLWNVALQAMECVSCSRVHMNLVQLQNIKCTIPPNYFPKLILFYYNDIMSSLSCIWSGIFVGKEDRLWLICLFYVFWSKKYTLVLLGFDAMCTVVYWVIYVKTVIFGGKWQSVVNIEEIHITLHCRH